MSKISKMVIFVVLLSAASFAENCRLSKNDWFKQTYDVVADCDMSLKSPDGHKVLSVKSDGKINMLLSSGEPFAVNYSLEAPAMVSWSPNSRAFFVNDGHGSGMSSDFNLFRLDKDKKVVRLAAVEQTAVQRFRKAVGCDSSAVDPNVWGIGWSSDGKQVFVLVQATVNQSCGDQGTFMGLVVNVLDGSVIQELTKAETRERFRSLLPHTFYKD